MFYMSWIYNHDVVFLSNSLMWYFCLPFCLFSRFPLGVLLLACWFCLVDNKWIADQVQACPKWSLVMINEATNDRRKKSIETMHLYVCILLCCDRWQTCGLERWWCAIFRYEWDTSTASITLWHTAKREIVTWWFQKSKSPPPPTIRVIIITPDMWYSIWHTGAWATSCGPVGQCPLVWVEKSMY